MPSGARPPYSLKRRLLATIVGAVAVVWVATAIYTYFDAVHEVNELLDAHLAQSASLLVALAEHELDEVEVEHAPSLHERGQRVVFQIWEGGTLLRLHSAHAPEGRLSLREHGFSSARIDGGTWRVFSTWDPARRFLVQVGERDDTRREVTSRMVANLLVPFAVALPVLGLFIWLSIGRGLGPLARVGREVEQRKADDFGALAAQDAPAEVVPLVRSLNALFERVARLVENERRFTADAAHELRTPLAALKTQAQVARGAADDAQRQHALDSVIAGCDRAARLVEQLLTLARLDPEPGERVMRPCRLAELSREVIAEAAPAALAARVEIELSADEAAEVMGYPDLIRVLVRNLVDNAVRYSPAGSTVRVQTRRTREGSCISVADEGPGLAPEERTKVGRRFYRVLGSGQPGSGLGLSIVLRIAQLHAAQVAFDAPESGKGLRVAVTFGAS